MRIADIVAIIMLVLVLATIAIVGVEKIDQAYHASRGSWYVKSVNYGFALTVNDEGDELVVRNPVGGIEQGDSVVIKGFGFSELPYIASKIPVNTK